MPLPSTTPNSSTSITDHSRAVTIRIGSATQCRRSRRAIAQASRSAQRARSRRVTGITRASAITPPPPRRARRSGAGTPRRASAGARARPRRRCPASSSARSDRRRARSRGSRAGALDAARVGVELGLRAASPRSSTAAAAGSSSPRRTTTSIRSPPTRRLSASGVPSAITRPRSMTQIWSASWSASSR